MMTTKAISCINTQTGKTGRRRRGSSTTSSILFIFVLFLLILSYTSRTTAATSDTGPIHTVESDPDSSDDSVVDKSPGRSDKSSIVHTLSKQERNVHNQQQLSNNVPTPSGPHNDRSTVDDSQIVETGEMTEPTKVVDVLRREVKDGKGNVGKCTGACHIEETTSAGQHESVPTGQHRMECCGGSLNDGERKDDVQASDGSFTHHFGWIVEGRLKKDRCIECCSFGALTDTNCELAHDWAQQQEFAGVIRPLPGAFGLPRVDLPRSLRGARSKGWRNGVRFLVDKGASGDKQDKNGQATLHVVSEEGHAGIVQLLLEEGASTDKEDKDGFTALDIAILNDSLDIAQKLCKKMDIDRSGLDNSASSLHWGAHLGRVEGVRELIKKGAGTEVRNEDSWTPLHFASWNGHFDIVQLLVDSNANIEVRAEGGWTPLHFASWNGHLDVVEFLVENKADIEAKDEEGGTSLHLASWNGHLDVVEFLVENKAGINAKDGLGLTPLHKASQNGNLDVVGYLRSKGGVEWEPSFVRLTLAALRRMFR